MHLPPLPPSQTGTSPPTGSGGRRNASPKSSSGPSPSSSSQPSGLCTPPGPPAASCCTRATSSSPPAPVSASGAFACVRRGLACSLVVVTYFTHGWRESRHGLPTDARLVPTHASTIPHLLPPSNERHYRTTNIMTTAAPAWRTSWSRRPASPSLSSRGARAMPIPIFTCIAYTYTQLPSTCTWMSIPCTQYTTQIYPSIPCVLDHTHKHDREDLFLLGRLLLMLGTRSPVMAPQAFPQVQYILAYIRACNTEHRAASRCLLPSSYPNPAPLTPTHTPMVPPPPFF